MKNDNKEDEKAKKKEIKEMSKQNKKEIIATLQDMDIDDIKCGICSWTPRWLQVRKIPVFCL